MTAGACSTAVKAPACSGFSVADAEFAEVRNLALQIAGIQLHARNREYFSRRCERVGISTDAGVARLLRAVEAGDAAARRQFISFLTTSFTGFFRNSLHFDIAAEHALKTIHRRGAARLWSAAAATGEEPYSLAMALLLLPTQHNPTATIVATDINADALDFAQRGEYDERSLQSLHPALRKQFFIDSAGVKSARLVAAIRRLVEFRELNLASSEWSVTGPFDVIFCRNVLMYLERQHRESALARMAALLSPDGLLILDEAEYPGKAEHLFGKANKGIYTLRPG
jgi:chemotaxis protein methyltransferase CheR